VAKGKAEAAVAADVRRGLVNYFTRNGYVRRPNAGRRKKEGSQDYKKGYEVRLVAYTAAEAKELNGLLKKAGLSPGKAFDKVKRIVVPIYGKEAYDRFEGIVGAARMNKAAAPKKKTAKKKKKR
jgi:hypothetical protein